MLNIKYAINNLIKNPIDTLLIIIQIVVALILLYVNVCYKNEIINTVNKINYLLKDKEKVFIIKNQHNDDLQKISIDDLESFNKRLNSSTDFKRITVLDESSFIKTFQGQGNFIVSSMTSEKNNIKFILVHRLSVGNGFFSNFNLKIKKGRIFTKSDYVQDSHNPIPIILGSNYSSIYKLGSKIQSLNEFNKIITFKVVGFLERNSYFGDGSSGTTNHFLDNYIIYPELKPNIKNVNMSIDDNDMKYKIFLYNEIFGSYLIVNNTTINNIRNINNELNNKNFHIKLESIDANLNTYRTMIKQISSTTEVLFIIIFIFASIGFVSSILYSILHRFKEFGIHLMHGATLNSIALITFYQISFVMLSSYAISLVFINFIFNSDPILKIKFISCLETFIVIVLLSILLSIIPIIKILNLQIGQLVKGDE